MPRRRTLTLYQGNAEGLRLAVQLEDDETPLDLTGVTLVMLVKPGRETADNDTDVIVLSSATGEIVIDASPASGLATINAPTTVTETAGVLWYRIDALPGPKTILYGPLTVEDT